MPVSKNALIPALITPLLVWRVYRRVRGSIGRQTLKPTRLKLFLGLIASVTVLALAFVARDRALLASFVGGLALGVPVGVLGLRLTRFETTDAGRFYTPNTYLGVALALLLVGRLVYRLVVLTQDPVLAAAPAMQSPFTLAILGLTIGYYGAYYAGLLFRFRSAAV